MLGRIQGQPGASTARNEGVMMLSDITMPDSSIVRQADELARDVSSDMLYNHTLRC